jgi:bifunctional non-homologous end joining protein LigD
MCAVALRHSARGASVASPAAGRRAPLPAFIEPSDPTLAQRAPKGEDWVYEIKADGYRAQAHLRDGNATVYSRTGLNWTNQFARIAEGVKKLSARDAVIDGEAAVYGTNGLPDFQEMRRATAARSSADLRYHAFDLLYLDGRDLRQLPYVERKAALERLLKDAPEALIYVEHLEAEDGQRVFEHACQMGLEGIVAKRRHSPYRSGRTDAWLKLKCKASDTFPIVAFVEKLGAKPRRIASLYVGRREGDAVLYAGKVQTGYTHDVAMEVRERLDPFITKKSPLSKRVDKPKATWVEPIVEAEIEYGALTDDGLLRAAVFKGLRDNLAKPDRTPKQRAHVSRHAKRSEHGVPPENILQLLPDAVAPSKEELRAYWQKSYKTALEYLGGGPLKLVRHAHGISFYHRGPLPPIPPSVHQLRIQKREGGEGVRVWVDDLDGLLGLVDMDAVELHPWAATVRNIEHPDRLVFDLDPGPAIAWQFVVETALKLRGSSKPMDTRAGRS